ncbi:sugar ABC transporter permease [Candidatus Poribacteria bacterium]|nr:sugar ABC transporter permease [Candidatus Poribacteria bacterium]MBT5533873.1 sugar ABC transporter permease [Candidatus Poribacteria bacterium]MBT5712685.1 sugar ABC transporter permease [Candidatus Poribacteria bacterium]MBT7098293.1 sugar ABC transporter permease [Candidatus Poribacteria bacterium]MBT7806787.1 sugar ABC transporter permease [Candidatus Poribacteria bacterium]
MNARMRQQRWTPYLFVAPFFVVFATFMVYPLVTSIWLSLHQSRGFQYQVFVGADNFVRLFHDPIFWKSVRNTFTFAAGTFLVQLPLALILALIVNSRRVRGRNLFRLAFFSPVLVAGVFIAIIFGLAYDTRTGLVNDMLSNLAFTRVLIPWLEDERWVMPAVILAGVWQWAGFNMIYFLAGLQGIRQELYEASSVDGANAWQDFWHITLPSLRPVITFVFVLSMIGSLQLFDLPWVLTNGGGGPNDSATTMVMYLYKNGFQFVNLGYAATIGWVLFAIIMAISVIQLRFFRFGQED